MLTAAGTTFGLAVIMPGTSVQISSAEALAPAAKSAAL